MKIFLFLLVIFCAHADEGIFMREFGINPPKILLHTDKWGVLPEDIDQDKYSFKDQPRHIIDWERLDPYNWLDFNYWKAQRAQRDRYPDWRLRMRDSQHTEKVAQVIQCYNQCLANNREGDHYLQYMSRIYEGDEVVTRANSYAWILLADGTILRMSPNTSLSFNDLNITVEKSQFYIRLNSGHIYVESRYLGKFSPVNLAESDSIFLPLLEKEANRQYYMIQEFKDLSDDVGLNYQLAKNPGHNLQYHRLNQLISRESTPYRRDSEIILAIANITLLSSNASFETWHGSFSKSLIKKYSYTQNFEPSEELAPRLTAYFRGYNNLKNQDLADGRWYEMDVNGRQLSDADLTNHKISSTETFVKRIPSIHLAREILLRRNFGFNFWQKSQWNEKKIAVDYGHRLWNVKDENEIEKRKEFLLEFIRRVETSNLNSVGELQYKKEKKYFDDSYISRAISEQLGYLKQLGSGKAAFIKEMTDTQYYVWMMRYGKKHYQAYSGKCFATKKGATSMDLSTIPSSDC